MDEAFDQSASKRALLALKITAVKVLTLVLGLLLVAGVMMFGEAGFMVAGMAGWRL
jgi:hypothetical protein